MAVHDNIRDPGTPQTFLGIPPLEPADAQALILPVPFEETTSYGIGTANGPAAIIDASRQVELYNPELGEELQELIKIATMPAVQGGLEAITTAVTAWTDKLVISLGGEHSITSFLVKPFLERYPNLSVLHIDAHTDMRDTWEGSKFSHACALRRVQELGLSTIVQVGIRNTAKEEQQYLNQDNIFWGNEYDLEKILNKLTEDVYLTFDVDGLDASVMPATGTPEPGGLSYNQALEIIKSVSSRKHLVAADFVEFSPIRNIPAYDFIIAKLIYSLLSYYYEKTQQPSQDKFA
jgi:N1-aminopropylagmatine ureohydrolase